MSILRRYRVSKLLAQFEESSSLREDTRLVESLGKIGDMRAVEALIDALREGPRSDDDYCSDEDYSLYHEAVEEALVKIGNRIGSEAIERLVSQLYRMNGLPDILLKLDRTKTIPILVNALQRGSFHLNKMAADTLDSIGWNPTNTQDKIAYLIASENGDALVDIGKAAVVPLISSLGRMISSDCQIEWAVKAIVRIDDPDSVKPLWELSERTNSDWHQSDIVSGLLMMGDEQVRDRIVSKLKNLDYDYTSPILTALWKSNWTPKNDIDQAYQLFWQKEFGKLADLGQNSTEAVVEVILRSVPKEGVRSLMNVLGMLGRPGVPYLIKKLQDRDFLIAPHWWNTIGEKKGWRTCAEMTTSRYRWCECDIIRVLGKIGDKRAAEAVISCLFEHPYFMYEYICDHHMCEPPYWEHHINACWEHHINVPLKNLFEDYTELVLNTSCYGEWDEGTEYNSASDMEYFFPEINYFQGHEAIRQLEKLNTAISNNILYKVSQRTEFIEICDHVWGAAKDLWVPDEESDLKTGIDHFTHQKKLATEILENRGCPPYEPSAYLEENAWKIRR